MTNEFIFDETQKSGFRLNTLELYNWGILQNNKIFSFKFDNKSTLLTGRNGSGKTTIVDAIITLLVPKRYRLYNQSSSGDLKDKARDEESYVLGAYGSSFDESSLSRKGKFLRDKNYISIINGFFANEVTGQEVSLLQVRYFSGAELVMHEGITEKKLLIEDIKAILKMEGLTIDRDKKWRQFLEKKCETSFWNSDNFSKYTSKFKSIFGLRDDSENKALKLFAQIVGMKELGNLNDFIRRKMLETVDVDNEFENLQRHYEKLIQCENEIEKTKCQLELLQPVVETGKRIEESEQKKLKLNSYQDALPCWYTKTAIDILNIEIKEKNFERERLEIENKSVKECIDNLSSDIETLLQNDGIQMVAEKSRQIKELRNKQDNVKKLRKLFEENTKHLNLNLPQSDKEFLQVITYAEHYMKNAIKEKEELDDSKTDVRSKKRESQALLEKFELELNSYRTRASNIPLDNIKIRKIITDGVGLVENSIPFVGELIQVKESEKNWTYAIEQLLHDLGLSLLVPAEHYHIITEYVKNHNLDGKVVYLHTDLQLEYDVSHPDINTVPGKIDIKQGSEFSSWLARYVYDKWNYICSDDSSVMSNNQKVISSTGFIKNGIKHEKDDSIKKNIRQTNVLGWDNIDKRKAISSQIEVISQQIKNLDEEESSIKAQLNSIEFKTDCARKIMEIKAYSEIDIDSISVELQNLIEEKDRIAKDNQVEDIEKQISEKRSLKEKLNKEVDECSKSIGRIENDIDMKQNKLADNEKVWNSIIQTTSLEYINSMIELLTSDHQIKKITSMQMLDDMREELNLKIDKDTKSETNTINSLVGHLKDYMREIKSPKEEYKKKYGDWTIQFADLVEARDYLEDWNNHYNSLMKDELPKYRKNFRDYLNKDLFENIVHFKQFISNGNQEIKNAIATLNINLKSIPYGDEPKTFLQLKLTDNLDTKISEFKSKLHSFTMNASGYQDIEEEEKAFRRIKDFIDYVKGNERNRKFILDLRNWYSFAAPEIKYEDGSVANYHSDSNSLSGGEKAKLTYTILASAIVYQFGINENTNRSLRFVIVDEVFSKSDSYNAQYAMRLFKQLDLQVMIVTPLDKLNIAEEYISSIHQVQKIGDSSRVLPLTIERFREYKSKWGNVND